jgi:XTP/dITP diphosphohydrolase
VATLVIATRNKGKIAEIARILSFDSGIQIRSVAEFDLADIEETGTTFEENAALKALTVARATGFAALADDSGLEVDALNGAPGIFSARFAGSHGDDQANNEKLLAELASVAPNKRSARFVAVIAVAKPDGSTIMARGELVGEIALSAEGENGFGYDPLFLPQGSAKTLGEFEPGRKDEISHRAKALAEIAPRIPLFLSGGE